MKQNKCRIKINPVAKNLFTFNKPKVEDSLKSYNRKKKHKLKEEDINYEQSSSSGTE